MSINDVAAEKLAALFHHYHQALGPDFGCKANGTRESWERLPEQERGRAVAATRLALLEIAQTEEPCEDSRRYFAKPGAAEWGC